MAATHDHPDPLRRLLLVRHGLPDYSGGQAGDELPGPPLSPTGFRQTGQAAEVVRPFAPQVIYASPLARTVQTAECLGRSLHVPLRIESELREWHRTERLYNVGVRLTRWLVHWLRGGECCAVVVSHASPLLALLRSALYLPHVNWHKTGYPDVLEISSGDRFEVSMASVFELVIAPETVTARLLAHPQPRIFHRFHNGATLERVPRPMTGAGENAFIRRPNYLRLVGYRGS